jgi:hypothetical protein
VNAGSHHEAPTSRLIVICALATLVAPLASDVQPATHMDRIGRLSSGNPPAGPDPSETRIEAGLGIPATLPSVRLGMVSYGLRKERLMSARIRQFVLGSALGITLTVPVTAGVHSDAELLAQMQQEVQKLQEQLATTDAQCQAGQRLACEQGSPRREQLARMQLLIKECQQDDRESCTQLRSLRRR